MKLEIILFIHSGGCLGYLITAISWNAVYMLITGQTVVKSEHGEVYDAAEKDLYQERSVFSILGVLYAVFACTTLISAKDSIRNLNMDRDRLNSEETENLMNHQDNSYNSRPTYNCFFIFRSIRW